MVVKSGTLQFNFLSSFRNLGMLEIAPPEFAKRVNLMIRYKVSSPAGNYQSTISDDISGSTIYFSDSTFIYIPFNLL